MAYRLWETLDTSLPEILAHIEAIAAMAAILGLILAACDGMDDPG